MFSRKLLMLVLTCSAQAHAETVLETGSDSIRAAGQLLALYRNELDCENVGYIQTGEVDEHFAPIFSTSDFDKSRTLTRSEFLNTPFANSRPLLGIAFSEMDKDGDGSATSDEMREYLNGAVAAVDGNGDGDIYPAEYEHALKTGTILRPDSEPVAKNEKSKYAAPPWLRHREASIKINFPKSAK